MDGLNLKIVGDPIKDYFVMDKYGSLIPDRSHLVMDEVRSGLLRQLKADTGLYSRLAEMYARTDVEFTDNPYGNSPTVGVGFKLYGKRPLNRKREDRFKRVSGGNGHIKLELEKRQRKIVMHQEEYMKTHAELKPTDENSSEYLQWLVEGDQVMTGGGFDGNSIGEVHQSALNFVNKSNEPLDYKDSQFSALVVEASLWIRDQLIKAGLRLGSLKPIGAHTVRVEQETDGMLGYPVYSKAFAALPEELALRLLICSGVDIRGKVGSLVKDEVSGEMVPYRVVDACADILDSMTIRAHDLPSVVTLLARIQKHGWKVENDEVIPSKPKTRSIYPNAILPSMIEAMAFTPFLDECKRLKVPFMPSLQDKPTRVDMIKNMIIQALQIDYDFLAADWSKWDATVKGHILATIIYYAIRPFYNSNWQSWVDYSTYALTYKYLMCDTNLCSIWSEELQEAQSSGPWVEAGPYTLFGLVDGLISGAKLTHVGGSLYGIGVIHYVIPKLLGVTPVIGCQAGDDTLVGVPRAMIDINDSEGTYAPIAEYAAQLGLSMNISKQVWHNVKGEVVKIFLQDVYHAETSTWGVGSIFRPLSAVFFSEREKGLSIAEQLMAEIARMNQGADCAFVRQGVEKWLSMEQALGALFKDRGISAFRAITESIGLPPKEIAQRVDVGSFSWGTSRSDLENGTLPILPIMADVASSMTFSSSAAAALAFLEPEESSDNDISSFDSPLADDSVSDI